MTQRGEPGVLFMTHMGSAGGQKGHFGGRFDKKAQFSAIWSTQMTLNPFIWTANQLLMLGEVFTDLKTLFIIFKIHHRGSAEPL